MEREGLRSHFGKDNIESENGIYHIDKINDDVSFKPEDFLCY